MITSQILPQAGAQISYAAGSTSCNPHGFRVVNDSPDRRFWQLAKAFPETERFLAQQPLLVIAYPATLGISGVLVSVDTYLHAPHFFRALRLAAEVGRPAVVVAQPLVGAHLLLQFVEQAATHRWDLPSEVLWVVGGYYFPLSLERFVAALLGDHGCRIDFLHAYGMAEVGHTCFAARERFPTGVPRYRQVAAEVAAHVAEDTGRLQLTSPDTCRLYDTGDYAAKVGGEWHVTNGPDRLSPFVKNELEQWTASDWQRRTGYLAVQDEKLVFQTRAHDSASASLPEISFYRFLERYGGGLTTKPVWGGKPYESLGQA